MTLKEVALIISKTKEIQSELTELEYNELKNGDQLIHYYLGKSVELADDLLDVLGYIEREVLNRSFNTD